MTLNRKSEGHGHRDRSQFRKSHQGLFPCKVSSLYWLMWPRRNLNTKVNQNVDRRTDGRTDRPTSSIYKPELLCNPAKKVLYLKFKVLRVLQKTWNDIKSNCFPLWSLVFCFFSLGTSGHVTLSVDMIGKHSISCFNEEILCIKNWNHFKNCMYHKLNTLRL